MKQKIFITGINTEVGKTVASAIITEALEADYWKPIQSGELSHTDSMKVAQWVCNKKSEIHPEFYQFQAPESPHFAASLENKSIQNSDFHYPKTDNYLVIEGAGGICVPINNEEFFIDQLPKNTPIILVSKNELGSINATLLSLYYLHNEGFLRVGVLFNGEKKTSTESIIAYKTKFPILGRIKWTDSVDQEFVYLEAQRLKDTIKTFIEP